MDSTTFSVVVSLLMVVGIGALGAIVGSFFGARQKAVEDERSPHPYVGFIVGSIVGVAAAALWRL